MTISARTVDEEMLPVTVERLFQLPIPPSRDSAELLVAQQIAQVPFLASQLTQCFAQSCWQQLGTT